MTRAAHTCNLGPVRVHHVRTQLQLLLPPVNTTVYKSMVSAAGSDSSLESMAAHQTTAVCFLNDLSY